jgi:uncharacterized membrane protein
VVLGLFAMTISYLLLVLRTVTENLELSEVPHLAVSVGTALALSSLFVLLFFVHHLARSVVSNHIVAKVSEELHRTIDRLLPKEGDSSGTKDHVALAANLEGPPNVQLECSGYVQAVAFGELTEAARRRGAWVRLDFRAGQFIMPGVPLAHISPRRRPPSSPVRSTRRS